MSVQRQTHGRARELRSRRVLLSGTPESRGFSDSDLLALISRGDLDAFGVIYDRHIEAAWKIALHYSANTAAAEQAVSAVFLRLWRNPEVNDQTSLPARLLASVAREARDYNRF